MHNSELNNIVAERKGNNALRLMLAGTLAIGFIGMLAILILFLAMSQDHTYVEVNDNSSILSFPLSY